MDVNTKECITGALACIASVTASVCAALIAYRNIKKVKKNEKTDRVIQRATDSKSRGTKGDHDST